MTYIDRYAADIKKLCALYNVKTLYAFGSVVSDQLTDRSDVDFIVDFDAIDIKNYADNYFDFKFSLQDILKRPIDLIEKGYSKPLFQTNRKQTTKTCLCTLKSLARRQTEFFRKTTQ